MATTAIKTTYSLDANTVDRLQKLSHEWRVSKSEVIRRAIAQAAGKPQDSDAQERVKAFKRFIKSFERQDANFKKWKRDIQRARR